MTKLIALTLLFSTTAFLMSKGSSKKSKNKKEKYIFSKEVILGKDQDNNGVRDDVDEWIKSLDYGQNIKNALTQSARAQTKGLIEYRDKDKALKNAWAWDKASSCTSSFFRGDQERLKFHMLHKQYKALILNTRERIIANGIYNDHLHGSSRNPELVSIKSREERQRKTCEFKIIK